MIESILLFLVNLKFRSSTFAHVRSVLLRLGGMGVGERCVFYGSLRIRPIGAFGRISVGSRTFINEEVRLSCPGSNISIGKNCLIGPRCAFECASHTLKFSKDGRRKLVTDDIIVGNNVWIGAGVIVLGGSVISDGAIIGACSLVKGYIEGGWIYAGVPARKVKRINED